jgi:hypothetical protein
MRENAMRLLASQLWRDANEPADMDREVSAYVLPDDVEAPHDLAPYRVGQAIGAAQRGEGE